MKLTLLAGFSVLLASVALRADDTPLSPQVLNGHPQIDNRVVLKVGETKEVFVHDNKESEVEHAFYVPAEGSKFVQVTIEKGWGKRTYILKGLAKGKIMGGVVERKLLDSDGFLPRKDADLSKIQEAIQAKPYLIIVQ